MGLGTPGTPMSPELPRPLKRPIEPKAAQRPGENGDCPAVWDCPAFRLPDHQEK
jgi:hypothetical protein